MPGNKIIRAGFGFGFIFFIQGLAWPLAEWKVPIEADELTQQARDKASHIQVEVNLVLLDASVLDKDGKIVSGLEQKDFELYEDKADKNHKQQIAHFSQDQIPLAAALVVDISVSINKFIPELQRAALLSLRSLKEEDSVTLYSFAGNVHHLAPLTRDRTEISNAIQTGITHTEQDTSINDVLYEATRYLQQSAPDARRAIILVSDNFPISYSVPRSKIVAEALESGVTVYSIKVHGDNPAIWTLLTLPHKKSLVNVPELVEETGGELFKVEDRRPNSFFDAFQAVIERLKTRYTIGFYPSHSRDGKSHRLILKLTPEQEKKGYKVRTRRRYYSTDPVRAP